jgi:hypothetical protein
MPQANERPYKPTAELSMAGDSDDELALEGMRLVWPAYFANPEGASPVPELRIASERSAKMVPLILAELPALERGCRASASRRLRPRLAEFDAARSLGGCGGADSMRLEGGGRRPRAPFDASSPTSAAMAACERPFDVSVRASSPKPQRPWPGGR